MSAKPTLPSSGTDPPEEAISRNTFAAAASARAPTRYPRKPGAIASVNSASVIAGVAANIAARSPGDRDPPPSRTDAFDGPANEPSFAKPAPRRAASARAAAMRSATALDRSPSTPRSRRSRRSDAIGAIASPAAPAPGSSATILGLSTTARSAEAR